MITLRRWLLRAIAALLVSAALPADAQVANVTATNARAFVGTWVFSMSNLGGSQQTVRIWEEDGALKASVQVGKGPPTGVTGILKDGDMLVLSVSHEAQPGLRENGQPIWALISLTLQGETMHIAEMLEQSETIKRGTGKKQPG
jgi:hypothetical protein